MGRHQQYNRDLGQLPLNTTTAPGTTILTPVNNTTNAIRPYLGYTSVNFTEFGATSNYNALQTRLTRRFATHLTMNVAFVWSKAMDEVDSDGTAIGYYLDRRRDYARAGFDRTKVFNFDYVYELPDFAKSNGVLKRVVNGWQLAGFTRFWDGDAAQRFGQRRPRNPGRRTARGLPRAARSIPTTRPATTTSTPWCSDAPHKERSAAWAAMPSPAPASTSGTSPCTRTLASRRSVQAQFRVETFNTFNHTQWAGVNAGISVPNPSSPVTTSSQGSTGQVSSTRDPRNIQFGLKLLF